MHYNVSPGTVWDLPFDRIMALTFLSKALNRVVSVEELPVMSSADLNAFNAELAVAVRSMEDALSDALRREVETGEILDSDWVHKVRKKMRVAMAFRGNIIQILSSTNHGPSLEELVQIKLDELLIEELGERLYSEMKEEAKELAVEDLRARIQAS